MEEAKRPDPAEIKEVIDFLDKHLRPEHTWSIKDEYPLVFNEANSGNIRVIKQDGKILSHAVTKYLLIKTPIGIFKVAAIGSVVTDPSHRNLGHSQKVLQSSLDAAEAHGCDFAILWTDIYDFYRKLGFELAGSEIALSVDSRFSPPKENLRIEETTKISPDSLLRVYNSHSVGTIRTAQDFLSFLTIPNTNVYTAWNQQNVLTAYAVEGKGADLNGYIHEWGGGVSELMTLFSHIQKTQNRNVTVISPGHTQNLIRQMTSHGSTASEGFLGMIKILNTKNLFFKMKRYSRASGYDDFVLEKQGDQYYLGRGPQVFKTDCERDVVRLLFGPGPCTDLYQFDPTTAEMFNSLMPVPMWIWGWDSI